ncbi:YdcF family protein [Brevundimonas sp. M20]|uniref:YdcF family protein n=1 Tax=Brevundimonas sp. M20 TaxID=2591463 RepID=UPI001147736F|nr:YdcF family protein [Brevundimonas sp. M20]QDH74161.1 YdcF family protein [Brevundimonas sp. M20]
MLRRLWRALSAVAFLIVVVAGAGLALSITRYADQTSSASADAAMVLGAAVANRTPTPVFEERLRHAAGLYHAGRVRLVVVTGGRGPGDALSEGEAGRDWLIAHGVTAADIAVETRSRTTIQNLRFSLPILEARGVRTVLLVSDPLHMRRSTIIARRLGLTVEPSPTRTSRYRTWRTQAPFVARETWFLAQYLSTGL